MNTLSNGEKTFAYVVFKGDNSCKTDFQSSNLVKIWVFLCTNFHSVFLETRLLVKYLISRT